ncbi:ROK family protein [Microbacterium pygmaeum]|uniref:Glucokinase n=1 Tax=Microbacterium pygmaeum TaxID=370764 RepID=A0A1G7TXT4_9MICO|nr:ROK family protein [Microbacterium pygmaeum]SDG40053.1 glucokinase [Microbacterium pygmaeum]
MLEAVLAVDVGGTRIKAHWQDPEGRLLSEWVIPTPARDDPSDTIDAIVDLAIDGARQTPAGIRPVAIGLAVPGLVDERTGLAIHSENLGWRDVDLAARFRDRTQLPVAISQDVRAGARAESYSGSARGASSTLFVPIGTGVGAAIVLDGVVRAGPNNRAGEIGHIPAGGSTQPCMCGRSGCLESIASASAIRSRYNARIRDADAPVDGAAEVIARAGAGDRVAAEVWGDAIDALAASLSAADQILDLDLIVIGGGLSLAGETLLGPLRLHLAQRGSASTAVVGAFHRDLAGAVGAGLRAWELAR